MAMAVPLPGAWSRTTWVLPNPCAEHPDTLGPGNLFRAETTWLDEKLAERGWPDIDAVAPRRHA